MLGSVCQIAGARTLVDDAWLVRHGVIAAVQRRNTPAVFNWLIDPLSYHGVSDSIAYSYTEQHGRIRGQDIAALFFEEPSCVSSPRFAASNSTSAPFGRSLQ